MRNTVRILLEALILALSAAAVVLFDYPTAWWEFPAWLAAVAAYGMLLVVNQPSRS